MHTKDEWVPMMDGPLGRKPWEPWQAWQEAAPGLSIGSTGHTEPICRVSGYLRDAVANAKLIAAAPDLLAACEHLLKVLRLQPTPGLGEWNWPQMADDLQKVVAKAKGE